MDNQEIGGNIDDNCNDLSFTRDDLESSLVLSFEEGRDVGFDMASGIGLDIIATQNEIFTQVIETSEIECLVSSIYEQEMLQEQQTSLELSNLSEDDALETALISSSLNTSAVIYFDDDSMISAALNASMESSSDVPYEINDDDEDISRAIAESLRRL